jgi:uncharacterized membrane protein
VHRAPPAVRSVRRIFFAGLFTLLPAVITIYFVVWLVGVLESFFGEPVQWLLPEGWYRTGMGLVVAIAAAFGVGVLMRAYVFRHLFRAFEQLLVGIPLVRSIYTSLRDMVGLFAQKADPALQVVAIDVPGMGRLLGFVTRTEFADLPGNAVKEGEVAVYLPMAYNIGGYTVFLPRDRIEPVEMSREDAMKFILTAGVKARPEGLKGTPSSAESRSATPPPA